MLCRCLALALLILASLFVCAADKVILEPVLKNVETLPSADTTAIVQDLNKQKCTNIDELAERVRFTFQKYGYFKVVVADPIVPDVPDTGQVRVIPVDVKVTAGEKYNLRDITFESSSAFPAVDMRATFPINDGELFNREKIGIGLENLRKLYGSKGYINFSAVPETEVDDSTRLVALKIHLDEGSVFYLGSLIVGGEESQPGARNKLLNTWKAYEGQVYDPLALYRFLHDLHARPGVTPDQVFETSLDNEKHVANVHINLAHPIF